MKPKNIYRKKSLKDKRSHKRNTSKKYKERKSFKKYINLSKTRLLYSKKKFRKQKYHKKNSNKNHTKKKGGNRDEDPAWVHQALYGEYEKSLKEPNSELDFAIRRENLRSDTAKEKAMKKGSEKMLSDYKNGDSFLAEIKKSTTQGIRSNIAYYKRHLRNNKCPWWSRWNCLSDEDISNIESEISRKIGEDWK